MKRTQHKSDMVQLHIEIDARTFLKLKLLRPGYGEISDVVRNLIEQYVRMKTQPESTHEPS